LESSNCRRRHNPRLKSNPKCFQEFNADTIKTKLIFVVSQFVYTLVTLLMTPLLYSSYSLRNPGLVLRNDRTSMLQKSFDLRTSN
jgi:hypothetical protein